MFVVLVPGGLALAVAISVAVAVIDRATLWGFARLIRGAFRAGQDAVVVNPFPNLAVVGKFRLDCGGVNTLIVKELFDVFCDLGRTEWSI